eukprot:scaffold7500_cov127-Isochrysis_galbana.AAC.30
MSDKNWIGWGVEEDETGELRACGTVRLRTTTTTGYCVARRSTTAQARGGQTDGPRAARRPGRTQGQRLCSGANLTLSLGGRG